MNRRRLSSYRLAGAVVLTIYCALLLGCGDDTSVNIDGNGGTRPDTSTLSFEWFDYIVWLPDPANETGLELHWTLGFTSTRDYDCMLHGYQLLGPDGHAVYEDNDPSVSIIGNGHTLTGKVSFIPLESAELAGTYTFGAEFETGRMTEDIGGDPRWAGPFSTGRVDTSFSVSQSSDD
jgi:hypothetical protein